MNDFVFDKEVYHKNLNLLKNKNPLLGYSVDIFEPSEKIDFCHTKQNEFNLAQTKYGITDFFHSQEGALEEAKTIVSEEIAETTKVIYFYGLGLGYIYDGLQEWFKGDPDRRLILFEDDPQVIQCFLHTERAYHLLQNPQVILQEYSAANLQINFFSLLYPFINIKSQFLTLPYYILRKEKEARKLCYDIYYFQLLLQQLNDEYLSGQTGLIRNFYRNLLYLSDSYQSSEMYGKFKNIPAIICGAGPSIEKNIDILKKLNDRALIFAGGSSLNVVNSVGIIPHFGLGIDPNPEQLHRLLTSNAFYIPFFYRNRLTHEAFQMIQGEKIYASGSPHPIQKWFETKFNISAPDMEEGHNVVNFCMEIARNLGCNPIIFVGLDLSYKEDKTYGSGINIHPLWLGQSRPYSSENEQLIHRTGIDGDKIVTKWPWIAESIWIQHFATTHKDIEIINATEGGLGIGEVPNKTLREVAEKYLTRSFDFAGRIHGEIQNSKMTIQRYQIIQAINEMKISLERALKFCKNIVEAQQIHKETNKSAPYSGKAILNEILLQEEVCYENFLSTIDQAHNFLADSHFRHSNEQKDPVLTIIVHYLFLSSVIELHLDLLKEAMQKFIFSSPHTQEGPKSNYKPDSTNEEYQMQEGSLTIKDPVLEIDIEKTFTPIFEKEYYSSGELKNSICYNQQALEGPSRFFSKEGKILSETWFVNGLKEGKCRNYYASGTIRSIQCYRHHLLHGKQEYYFPQGSVQMILNFKEGMLEGLGKIYFPDGSIYRELNYLNGKRHGTESQWNSAGQLMGICEYENGIPIGVAKAWNSKGNLIKEVIIHRYPDDFDVSLWDDSGKLIKAFKHGVEDFSPLYTEKQNQVEMLHTMVNSMVEQLDSMLLNQEIQAKEFQEGPVLAEELQVIKESSKSITEMRDQLASMKEDYFKQLSEQQEGKRQSETG